MTKAQKSRLHADAIRILDEEIARCSNHSEYCERAKVEGYLRAKQLLLQKRREAERAKMNGSASG